MFQTLKDNIAMVVGGIFVCMFTGFALYWVNAGNFVQIDYPTTNPDEMTKAIDATIDRNSIDFGTWYKANTLIQCGTIFTGVAATILAALTTKENAQDIKIFTVTLTAVTTILVSSQSIFHIRENLDTFIKVNSDLDNLKSDYTVQKSFWEDKKDMLSLNKYIASVKHKLSISKEARLRAYAIIGPMQTSTNAVSPTTIDPNAKTGDAPDKQK